MIVSERVCETQHHVTTEGIRRIILDIELVDRASLIDRPIQNIGDTQLQLSAITAQEFVTESGTPNGCCFSDGGHFPGLVAVVYRAVQNNPGGRHHVQSQANTVVGKIRVLLGIQRVSNNIIVEIISERKINGRADIASDHRTARNRMNGRHIVDPVDQARRI